jgi:hypothetical protein
MTTIVIKDLPENIELDRQAMIAITGGARTRGHQPGRARSILRSTGILNYPANAPSPQQPTIFTQSVIGKSRK